MFYIPVILIRWTESGLWGHALFFDFKHMKLLPWTCDPGAWVLKMDLWENRQLKTFPTASFEDLQFKKILFENTSKVDVCVPPGTPTSSHKSEDMQVRSRGDSKLLGGCECEYSWLFLSIYQPFRDWWPIQSVPSLSSSVSLDWLQPPLDPRTKGSIR